MHQRKPSSSRPKSSRPKTLSEQQIRAVIGETFRKKTEVSDVQVRDLLKLVNKLLLWSSPLIARSPKDDIERLLPLLVRLRTALAVQLIKEHLAGVGRAAYLKKIMSGTLGDAGGQDTAHLARNTVKNLSDAVDQTLGWLKDQRGVDAYVKSLTTTLERTDVVSIGLPLIYETVFGSPCGNSRNGPGIRFILCVLRKAGLQADEDKTTASIVKLRTRRAAEFKEIRERIFSEVLGQSSPSKTKS